MTEQTKLKIIEVFGYKPEDLNCASADAAMDEIFETDHLQFPFNTLEMFITNCSENEFLSIKESIAK
jgi:hypothetical protein